MSIHSTGVVRLVAGASAIALVIASAGFGGVFAWKIGSQHSYILGCLTVLFALALEGIKPLAVCGVFTPRSLGSFIASLLVASTAIAYSLTSELSLVAMSKGDLRSEREKASSSSQKAEDRYGRASKELASLKPSRPVAEVEALVASYGRGQGRCAVENGTGRMVCPQAAPTSLLAELARAKRKAELDAILNEAAPNTGTVVADPGSQALATYLGSLGIVVSPDTLSQWLNLIPVLALELGSALAFVVVGSLPKGIEIAQPQPITLVQTTTKPRPTTVVQPKPQPLTVVQPSKPQPITLPTALPSPQLAGILVRYLQDHGGSIFTTERGLAEVLGSNKPMVRKTMHILANQGVLALEATKRGTKLAISKG